MHGHRSISTLIVALGWVLGMGAMAVPGAFGAELTAPVSARFAGEGEHNPSFRKHVLPLMSKVGCSGRACHGSFQGQGGFQLSLFGYDFKKDHEAITAGPPDAPDEARVNRDDPAQSLVLLKPTLQEKHKGKKLFEIDSWQYNIIHGWIADGAADDSSQTSEILRLEIEPAEIVFRKPGETAQLRVLAHWADGTVEDVTDITRFRTNDESIAVVDEATGVVTAAEPGDTHIVAFYDNGVAPVPVMLPVSDKNGERYPDLVASTEVDRLIHVKLRKLGILPSGMCTDSEFLRRVRLDMTGTLPGAAEVAAFLADERTDKRQRKIDELLASPEYAAWWTTKLCDITGNNSNQLRGGGNQNLGNIYAEQWYDWVHRRVAENVPYDQIVEGIALGVSRMPDQGYEEYCAEMSSYLRKEDPADFTQRPSMPYFYQRNNIRKPEEKALAFAYTFLGVRLACAECHKHPFDQWTQEDFKSFQAFFTGVTYRAANLRNKEAKELLIAAGVNPNQEQDNKLRRDVVNAAQEGKVVPFGEMQIRMEAYKGRGDSRKKKDVKGSSRVITPKVLGGEEVVLANYEDPRRPLMDWMRSPENPYFARAWVNRVWAHYFGVGIIDPADDLNLANPPSNAALLDYLAKGFIDSGYDMKWLHRTIAMSDAYQRSWETNETNALDRRNFSHALLRRIPAEVAFDALQLACAGDRQLATLTGDMSRRAIGGAGGQGNNRGNNDYPLIVFGKPDRLTTCDCERSNDPTLLQSLFLYNDGHVHKAIDGGGWIAQIQKAERGDYEADRAQLLRRLESYRKRGDQKKVGAMKEALAKLDADKPAKLGDRDSLVTELYLRTVSRMPSDDERRAALEHLAANESVAEGMRDLLWVMLNTKEFIVNH